MKYQDNPKFFVPALIAVAVLAMLTESACGEPPPDPDPTDGGETINDTGNDTDAGVEDAGVADSGDKPDAGGDPCAKYPEWINGDCRCCVVNCMDEACHAQTYGAADCQFFYSDTGAVLMKNVQVDESNKKLTFDRGDGTIETCTMK